MKVGDGSPIEVNGVGSLRLKMSTKCGESTILLTQVLCVPSLKDNIISGKLEEKGVKIVFSNGEATASKNEELLFIALRVGTMYVVTTINFKGTINDIEWMVARV